MSFEATSNPQYSQYIHQSRYARWVPEKKRRETWGETVDRYVDFFKGKAPSLPWKKLRKAIYDLEVMPSMRALMTAGPALERDHAAGYNCCYMPIEDQRAFDEALYLLSCGCGVGFSVEREYVKKLPEVAEEMRDSDTVIVVRDSKIGWAEALRQLVSLLYSGHIPKWDTSKVRPKGERLKTFGGRASGPEPLEELFRFTVALFKESAGRQLETIECHDLMCKIASCIVVGGVRRSAMISLSSASDDRLRVAKSGAWWERHDHRRLSNNSAVYERTPDVRFFMKEWLALYDSKSGERGLFNREAAVMLSPKRRDTDGHKFGTNPCAEIVLRPYQMCNLSEVVVRAEDTEDDISRKVQMAAMLGTAQATLVDFRYLRKRWHNNCAEERLLGVSLTGILDHASMGDPGRWGWLDKLDSFKAIAVETNKSCAKKIGIPQAAAVTCVKPSGTVSQLVDSASGIHPRYSKYYIRRVGGSDTDPLVKLLIDQKVPHERKIGTPSDVLFKFPMKAPKNAVTADLHLGIRQLELWKHYQERWCEHKPSMTAYYRDQDFMEMGAWVHKHFSSMSGVSFLPYDDHVYQQAPYEPIDEETYEKLSAEMPEIDWTKLSEYEDDDNTVSSQELACVGGACEVL